MRRKYRKKPKKYLKSASERSLEDLQREMIMMWHGFRLNDHLNAMRRRKGWKKLPAMLL